MADLRYRRDLPMRLPRVALVFPPTGPYCREDRCQSYFAFDLVPSMRPPLEEVEAAAGVRSAGGTPWLLDAPAMQLSASEASTRIVAFRPDVVVATATFGSLQDDLAFLAGVRARLPGIPVGLRGAPATVFGQPLLAEAPSLDFLIRGEPELSFAALVRDGLEGVGLITRDRTSPAPLAERLDELPRSDRSVLTPSLYRVRGTPFPQATVRVQRGCPFPCTYCLVASVSGRRARHRSADDIADEMASVWRDGTRFFYLRADTLTLDRDWAHGLAEAIRRRVPGAKWVSTTRVDCVDEKVLRALAQAGCYGLSFGVETGSVELGRKVKKVPDAEATAAAFRACDAAGIVSLMYVMLGFIWETPATLEETEAFVQRVRPDLLTLLWATAYPGTGYFEQVLAEGYVPSQRFAQAEHTLEPKALSTNVISRRATQLTVRHYARPSVVASVVRKLPAPALARAFLAHLAKGR